jgi:hypothetical protein
MDWGKFRDALDYGHHQLGISEELDNPQMRSEAYLNLARAHERLGELLACPLITFFPLHSMNDNFLLLSPCQCPQVV